MPKNNKRRAQLMEARKRRIIEGGPGGKSRSSDSAIAMPVPTAESGFTSRPPPPTQTSSASSSSSSSTATSRQVSVSAQHDGKSRSKRKLIDFPSASHNTEPSTPLPKPQLSASTTRSRILVDFSQVESLVAPLKCPQCKNSSLCLQVDDGGRKGLAVKWNIYCDICEENIRSTYISSKETNGRSP